MSASVENDLALVIQLLSRRVQPVSENAFQRLLHGRGGNISALCEWHIDQIGAVLLIVAYQNVGWETAWLQALSQWAQGQGLRAVWIQRRYVALAPISVFWGEPTHLPSDMRVTEDGLNYELRFANQNIGLFPDMLAGRRWVRDHCAGVRVLNLFAYTCGFSVAAVAGGAAKVVNIDMSKSSLAWGRRNHELNGHDKTRVQYFGHNVMKSFGRIERLAPFDLIIVDPPSFQRGHFEAPKDYRRLLKRLPDWLIPAGRAMCCLNDPLLSQGRFFAEIIEPSGLSIVEILSAEAGSVAKGQTQALKTVITQKARL
jgi:23S rRNA (cytosine1962-C5)-methyltransferase